MRKVKIAMISFAHLHAYSYFSALQQRNDIEITGIADENFERVKAYTEPYRIPYFHNVRDLLACDADAVIICSENVRHAELAIAAAEAKKHVLCEKPLGLSKEEMLRMIEACKKNGVQLMTAFPCRFSPSVIAAKAAVEHGEIGEVLAIKGFNRGLMPGGWFVDPCMSGGGAVLDHTVHVTDLMNWILKSKVKTVYAEIDTLFHDMKIDDAGMLNMTFENGTAAVLDTSWSRCSAYPTWGDVAMHIIGSKGTLFVDVFAQSHKLYSNEEGKTLWTHWGDNIDDQMIGDFVDAVRNNRPPAVTGEDGMNAAVVAFAAYESAKQGKPVSVE